MSSNAPTDPKSSDHNTPTESPTATITPSSKNPSSNPTETNPNPATATTASTTTTPQPAQIAEDEDEDSDFDELDDVLDNFNKPQPSTAAAAAANAPTTTSQNPEDVDLDEEAFLKQLEKDMADLMGGGGGGAGPADAKTAESGMPAGFGDDESLDKDAEMFAKYLEESGVSAEDFLKQLVGDMMKGESKGAAGSKDPAAAAGTSSKKKNSKSKGKKKSAGAGAGAAGSNGNGGATAAGESSSSSTAKAADAIPETFNDTIQRTIERMKESGDKATAAAEEDGDDANDLVAQLIKAIEAGAGAGGDGDDADLTKMFMGMMEQLSNKEILYEPMKELNTKFGPWIAENKASGKVSDEEMVRYEKQAGVVAQIVAKFEEEGYTDEDAKCREYVWEKMQEMQACGNPPDELISAPMMEDLMGGGGAGAGAPDCPQQ
ncbi:putative peroxisomal membrane protein receptor Pex19 [Aspergillus homomorphus CBS 101889]|uniref:Pex19-domain-containing protein n=1 Tax=Aspergillus homomorphus (strain CBS 101889) TaxID=1450537 RepID=A0A395I6M0_ASPHC|nr:Pex19-domain-containing protein [Aspergillus homomorphus CBS 101889]RAL15486.1 Pex19-domain-containing protein [Aspergillus homomorphus CBS 101889]